MTERRHRAYPRKLTVVIALAVATTMVTLSLMNSTGAPAPTGFKPAAVVTTPPSGSPSPTPAPTTSAPAAPTPGSSTPDEPPTAGGCSWFDIPCKIGHSINNWFRDLVTSALNPVFEMLGQALLSTPQVDQMPQVRTLWTSSAAIANSCLVVLVVAAGILLMNRGSLQTSYAAKDVAPRLVVAVVAANLSLLIAGKAIGLANGLSAALLGPGVDPEQASHALTQDVARAVSPPDAAIFVILLGTLVQSVAVVLICIFIVRIMLTTVLIAAAPLALMCHALPQTDPLARLWWRALAGVLAIQVAQAIVLIAAIRIFLTHDMATIFGIRSPKGAFELLLVLCLLYILVRIPAWISRLVWRRSLSSSPLVRMARTVAAIIIFRGLGAAKAGIRAGTAASSTRPRLSGPTARVLPRPSSTPGPSQGPHPWAQPQPRWAHPNQQWTPPGPYPPRTPPPAQTSTAQQQRWGNPATTWQQPYAGPWQRPPAPPRQPPVIRMWPPPRPGDPWSRPK